MVCGVSVQNISSLVLLKDDSKLHSELVRSDCSRHLEVLPIHSYFPHSQHGFATPYFGAKNSIVPTTLSCSSWEIRGKPLFIFNGL